MSERSRFRSNSQKILGLLLLSLLLTALASAEPGNPPSITEVQGREAGTELPPVNLEYLTREMLAANPDLQAERKRWEAIQKRPGQESALPDPTVRLGWASAGAPYPGAGLGSEPTANLGIEFSQVFPFPGKRGLRGSMAQEEVRAQSFTFQGTELNLVSRLKSAFYELQFTYDAIDVLTRNKILLGQLAKLAENRYSVGQATQQDLIKSQVELSLIETRLLEAERNKRSMVAAINSLLNRDVSAILGRPEPPAEIPALLALESLQKTAVESSPMLHAQRATIDNRQLGLELSRRDYYPDFEVMGGYFNQGSMKDMWEFRVQVNIPIFFARKQRLGVEEAGARLSEAQKTYQAGEQTINYRIKDQYLAAENARRLMELYSKLVIPQASLALESSMTSYSAGSIDFLSVLSNFSTILENEMKYYESRARLLQSIAVLSELVGESVGG
jgi:outer membrane protein, heavy metal efflux system